MHVGLKPTDDLLGASRIMAVVRLKSGATRRASLNGAPGVSEDEPHSDAHTR